jgi:hypothetical protein
MPFCRLNGDINIEDGPLPRSPGSSNSSTMILHDLFHDGKTDSRAHMAILQVQPLKHFEDLFAVLGFKADAVIRKTEMVVGTGS